MTTERIIEIGDVYRGHQTGGEYTVVLNEPLDRERYVCRGPLDELRPRRIANRCLYTYVPPKPKCPELWIEVYDDGSTATFKSQSSARSGSGTIHVSPDANGNPQVQWV